MKEKRHGTDKQRRASKAVASQRKMGTPESGGPREENESKLCTAGDALDDVIFVPISHHQIHALTPWASLMA